MPRDTGDTTQTSSTLTSSRASAHDTQLEEAIRTAKSKRLRSTLLAICRDVPQAATVAQRRLLVESESASSRGTERKRMRPRFAICRHCEEEFDVTENSDRACRWHKGELEVDYDGEEWADWDDAHGEIDTPENREEYPQGFMYKCCQGDGDSRGCKRGPHVSRETSVKRSRY